MRYILFILLFTLLACALSDSIPVIDIRFEDGEPKTLLNFFTPTEVDVGENPLFREDNFNNATTTKIWSRAVLSSTDYFAISMDLLIKPLQNVAFLYVQIYLCDITYASKYYCVSKQIQPSQMMRVHVSGFTPVTTADTAGVGIGIRASTNCPVDIIGGISNEGTETSSSNRHIYPSNYSGSGTISTSSSGFNPTWLSNSALNFLVHMHPSGCWANDMGCTNSASRSPFGTDYSECQSISERGGALYRMGSIKTSVSSYVSHSLVVRETNSDFFDQSFGATGVVRSSDNKSFGALLSQNGRYYLALRVPTKTFFKQIPEKVQDMRILGLNEGVVGTVSDVVLYFKYDSLQVVCYIALESFEKELSFVFEDVVGKFSRCERVQSTNTSGMTDRVTITPHILTNGKRYAYLAHSSADNVLTHTATNAMGPVVSLRRYSLDHYVYDSNRIGGSAMVTGQSSSPLTSKYHFRVSCAVPYSFSSARDTGAGLVGFNGSVSILHLLREKSGTNALSLPFFPDTAEMGAHRTAEALAVHPISVGEMSNLLSTSKFGDNERPGLQNLIGCGAWDSADIKARRDALIQQFDAAFSDKDELFGMFVIHSEKAALRIGFVRNEFVSGTGWTAVQSVFPIAYIRSSASSEDPESFSLNFATMTKMNVGDTYTVPFLTATFNSILTDSSMTFEVPMTHFAAELLAFVDRGFAASKPTVDIVAYRTEVATQYGYALLPDEYGYCDIAAFMPRIIHATNTPSLVTYPDAEVWGLDSIFTLATSRFDTISAPSRIVDAAALSVGGYSAFSSRISPSLLDGDSSEIFDIERYIRYGDLLGGDSASSCAKGFILIPSGGSGVCQPIPAGYTLDSAETGLEKCPDGQVCSTGNHGPVPQTSFRESEMHQPSHKLSLVPIGTDKETEDVLLGVVTDYLLTPAALFAAAAIVVLLLFALIIPSFGKVLIGCDKVSSAPEEGEAKQGVLPVEHRTVLGGLITLLLFVVFGTLLLNAVTYYFSYDADAVLKMDTFQSEETLGRNTKQECSIVHTGGVPASDLEKYDNSGVVDLVLRVATDDIAYEPVLLNSASYRINGCSIGGISCDRAFKESLGRAKASVKDQKTYYEIPISDIILKHPDLSSVKAFRPVLSNTFSIELKTEMHVSLASLEIKINLENGMNSFGLVMSPQVQHMGDRLLEAHVGATVYRTSIRETYREKKTFYVPVHQISKLEPIFRNGNQLDHTDNPTRFLFTITRAIDVVHCDYGPLSSLNTLVLAFVLVCFSVWEIASTVITVLNTIQGMMRNRQKQPQPMMGGFVGGVTPGTLSGPPMSAVNSGPGGPPSGPMGGPPISMGGPPGGGPPNINRGPPNFGNDFSMY